MDQDQIRKLAVEVTTKAAIEGDDIQEIEAHSPDGIEDQIPLTIDLVTFVMWLRDSSDFFSGPELTFHFPKVDEESFNRVLADLALQYTGE
jgi:hypothetical protein